MNNSKCPLCDSDIEIYDYYYRRGEYFLDHYLKEGEYFILCKRCGYYYAPKLTGNSEEIKPIAATLVITIKNNIIIHGGVKTEKEMYEFRKSVFKNRDDLIVAEFRYIKDKHWIIEDILKDKIIFSSFKTSCLIGKCL